MKTTRIETYLGKCFFFHELKTYCSFLEFTECDLCSKVITESQFCRIPQQPSSGDEPMATYYNTLRKSTVLWAKQALRKYL